MRKLITASVFVLLSLCFAAVPLSAEYDFTPDYHEVASSGFTAAIYDDADLLSKSEELEIGVDYLLPIAEQYGNAYLITLYSDGTEISTLGDQLFDQYIGNTADGILFTIDMKTRQLGLWSDGSVLEKIRPSTADSILDNWYTSASRGDFAGCAEGVFGNVYDKLGGKHIPTPMKWISAVVLGIIIGALITYARASSIKKNSGVSNEATAAMTAGAIALTGVTLVKIGQRTHYNPPSSSSSSGGGHYGGGGGFSGGGHSGGGGSHGF
jgi:uncharacterized protein